MKLTLLIALMAWSCSASPADEVRTRQGELEQALIHADMAKLDQMLTSDFIRTPPGGRDTDKAQYVELISSGRLRYLSFEDRDVKYRVYGDTVLVNMESHLRTRSGANPETETTLKLIWVWVKRDGQWLVAGVEGTEVRPANASRR
jgi:ketosteroid isomerase-like protein